MEYVKGLAGSGGAVHTPSMALKHASFLAFVGTLLLTILLIVDLILNLFSIMRGLIPAVMLLTSLIYAFAALSITVFFYAFHRSQPRF